MARTAPTLSRADDLVHVETDSEPRFQLGHEIHVADGVPARDVVEGHRVCDRKAFVQPHGLAEGVGNIIRHDDLLCSQINGPIAVATIEMDVVRTDLVLRDLAG